MSGYKRTKECNLHNLNESLENINYKLVSDNYEHYHIEDYKGRKTGWTIWDETASYKTKTVTDPITSVHFMFDECVIKANDKVVTIAIKYTKNPGVFVSFYNFENNKELNKK